MFLSLSYPSGVLICVCYTYYSPTIFGSCILVLFSLCFSVLEVAVERASSSQSPSLAVSCCQQAHQRLLHFWDSVFGLQHVFVIPRISHRSCNSSDRPPPLFFTTVLNPGLTPAFLLYLSSDAGSAFSKLFWLFGVH